ncbi:MAG: bifunctional 5,10-methylenetetrahydrofolate dehydrogenase/5,10-methenyltetrahydrofolate cyclohydrolase [Patescibacteria group bacterium]|nr:bifunctional 5,10-methylenetetrahydrofolate dehydrogenase/5,10-methenyltetrahydrofolate cyclohydrolase [Patescibacteria group bacterium]
MLIDGRNIARDIRAALRGEHAQFLRTPVLGVLMGEGDRVVDQFVRIKERTAHDIGVTLVRQWLSSSSTTEDALDGLARLCKCSDGVIVQLPLPASIESSLVVEAIPAEKDIDGIGKTPRVFPPVIEAMKEILKLNRIGIAGKDALIVGRGRLVGGPAAKWLASEGAHTTILAKDEKGLVSAARRADIIVLGAGAPGLLTPDMVKKGSVILDAGTSEEGGEVRGDADPRCAEEALIFTPVPGGIGPIAVSMIFKNLFLLMQKENPSESRG